MFYSFLELLDAGISVGSSSFFIRLFYAFVFLMGVGVLPFTHPYPSEEGISALSAFPEFKELFCYLFSFLEPFFFFEVIRISYANDQD